LQWDPYSKSSIPKTKEESAHRRRPHPGLQQFLNHHHHLNPHHPRQQQKQQQQQQQQQSQMPAASYVNVPYPRRTKR
jgi:hypothetical protein